MSCSFDFHFHPGFDPRHNTCFEITTAFSTESDTILCVLWEITAHLECMNESMEQDTSFTEKREKFKRTAINGLAII